MSHISKLSKRTALLISQGFKSVGVCEDAYWLMEENLYINEAESVKAFVFWLIENKQHMGKELPAFIEENYPILYKDYFLKEKK